VKQVADYRQHADEARELAANAKSPEERAALHQIAQMWESLARERERRLVDRNPN
jgi:hypothetical protein